MNVSFKSKLPGMAASILLGITIMVTGCRKEEASGEAAMGAAGGAPPVDVVTVRLDSIKWEQTYPGRAEGKQRVTIRPRVGGVIKERTYEEGKMVESGELLFQIDPEPYEAVVNQATARLEQAEAALRQAERDKARSDKLFETDSLSERQHEYTQSAYELAQAEVALARATLKEAQLHLDYTFVTSPISGVTSREQLPAGSLVNAGDALTTVTELDPMYVLFSLPEGDPAYRSILSHPDTGDYTLQLQFRNNRQFEEEGHINFTETRVDEATGTIRVRATFPNPGNKLLPGQFVRIRFDNMKLPDAAIIPPKAVLATPMGSMVYVLGEGNTVTPRPIVLGPVIDGGQLVMSGLQSGDRVISSSLIRIRPGMPVTPVEKAMAPEGKE